MKLTKLVIAEQEDLKRIIDNSGIVAAECEINIYYRPEKTLYDATLVIVLADQNQEVTVEVATYYQNMLNYNLGKKTIGRDFSTEFISELNDYINEQSAK